MSERRIRDPGYGPYGVVDAAGRGLPPAAISLPFSVSFVGEIVLCFIHDKSLASPAASLLSAAWREIHGGCWVLME